MALTLFGVTFSEGNDVRGAVPQSELVVVRDLAAICATAPDDPTAATPERVQRHSDLIGAYSSHAAVLPAPFGVVFRTRESVERWLELHYVALSDALSFVDNRVAARVHVWRPGPPEEREAGSDLAAVAAESLRALRRSAVTTVPLRVEKVTGIVLSAAFLVEQELWNDFARAVEAEGQKAPSLRFELTGPWPPYDFVQMQLGA